MRTSYFKKIALYLFVLMLTFSLQACSDDSDDKETTGPPPLEGWNLVWNDEFDGADIDPTKWEHEVNAQGGGNNELQYYTDRQANSYVEDGKLIIQALQENFTGPEGTRDFTSARLRTKDRGDWLYGRFDIRAKLPKGQGLWPAIWMLPTDWEYGGWAASGEIDIMELVGHEPGTIHGTIHYGGEYPENTHTGNNYSLPASQGDFSDDFHTFSIIWEENSIEWYVDDIHYLTLNQWHSTGGPYPAPFDKRFHLLLNVAVGGNWPGNPDETTQFPQTMEVEYVRVYERAE